MRDGRICAGRGVIMAHYDNGTLTVKRGPDGFVIRRIRYHLVGDHAGTGDGLEWYAIGAAGQAPAELRYEKKNGCNTARNNGG